LPVAYLGVRLLERCTAVTKRLDLRPRQHETGLDAVEEVVVVASAPVVDDELFPRCPGHGASVERLQAPDVSRRRPYGPRGASLRGVLIVVACVALGLCGAGLVARAAGGVPTAGATDPTPITVTSDTTTTPNPDPAPPPPRPAPKPKPAVRAPRATPA